MHIRSQRGTELQSRDPVYHAQELLFHNLKSFNFNQQALALWAVGGIFCYIGIEAIMDNKVDARKRAIRNLYRKENHMKQLLIASALTVSLMSTGAFAQGEAASLGSPGDPGQVSRTVEITMVDNRFKPSEVKVKQGETVKFVLKNSGEKKHEMMIGTPEEIDEHGKMMKKFPDMEHAHEGNLVTVDPGKTGELVWHFTEAGIISFACPLPGHFKGMNFPGMKGTITVEAK